jgi:hypothetical protein
MRFPFCVVPCADHTNEPEDRAMTASSFAPTTTQAAAQIRLRSLAAPCEAAMKPELCHARDSRRGWDYGNTFGRWPR